MLELRLLGNQLSLFLVKLLFSLSNVFLFPGDLLKILFEKNEFLRGVQKGVAINKKVLGPVSQKSDNQLAS